MRNPFRRRRHDPCSRVISLASDERYAADAMPADWPAFTADLFEQEPRQWRDHTAREWAALTEPPVIDAWEHVDAVLAKHPMDDTVRDYEWGADGGTEHPAVIDLRAAVNMVRAHDTRDPLEAHTALMLARHEEDIAYGRGMMYDGYEADLLDVATGYLEDREHGARLAALVLAGYTGTPREFVR